MGVTSLDLIAVIPNKRIDTYYLPKIRMPEL